jgi:hypothetical protein
VKDQRVRSTAIALLAAAFCALAGAACSDGGQPPLVPAGDAGSPDAPPRPEGDSGTDAGPPPAPLCPAGTTLVQRSLATPPSLPALADIDLPNLHPSSIIVPAGSGASDSMRFDFCQGPEGTALRGILLRGNAVELASRYVIDGSITSPSDAIVDLPEGKVREIRLPPQAAIVDGVAEALAGDIRAFRVRLLGDQGLLIVGHATFLAIARGRVQPASIEYTALYVWIGGLAPGDIFAGLVCPFGQDLLTSSFSLGTAAFELEACSFLGGGITTGYRIHRFAVQDSSPELQEAHRARFELKTEAEVAAALTYKWNHHNACDSFYLALPHAEYAASAAPAAGCGPTVPNAPVRNISEPDNSPLRYRIRYYGGAWIEGSKPGCSHFIGRCN